MEISIEYIINQAPSSLLIKNAQGENKMDELINLVAQKTGLAPDKAKVAVQTVVNFIKQKLPPAIAGQVDSILAGKGVPDDLTKGLGGLLGGKK